MKGNELRRAFLEYFEKHGHKIVHSSPVYPPNDPTILFTNAGMNQFKDVFLGNEKREYTRAASSQKCIRAGGKHNDLDEVGKTARHHTFFEMLGNFSFGDYFKANAINFAWDFLVNELKLDVNRLWFTVFAGDEEVSADDEAAELWIKAGAPPDRILRFGRKDNFWQMAETGPCGPNSEINYYLGDEPENPEKNRADLVNAEMGDTTMEIWNLVFMQYNRVEVEKGVYKLEPLPAPSVDTGAGLERMAVVMEGVHSNYETSLIRPIIDFIAELAGKKYVYDSTEGFAVRVVADHARTTAFSIADGILPGNEGRAYVLRKIMRRAIYHGREHLNFHEAFFYKVCNKVVDEMKDAYPELETQREFIKARVLREEIDFGRTLTFGSEKFSEYLKELDETNKKIEILFDDIGTPDFNDEEFDRKIEQLSTERKKLIGNADVEAKLAKLSYQYKIPPIIIELKSTNFSNSFNETYQFDKYGFILWLTEFFLRGTDEEINFVNNLGERFEFFSKEYTDEFINKLDIWFKGIDTLKTINFKNFADLYNTFGYPKDLIRVGLEDYGIKILEENFNKKFDEALIELQNQSAVGKTERKSVISPIYHELLEKVGANKFHGYDATQTESTKVVAIVKDDQQINELKEGEEGLIVLSDTPFYAESGGQVGDTGFLTTENSKIKVLDTFAPVKDLILHKSKVEKGVVKVGDELTATVDAEKRDATRRNHTATHLVHAALREVLGTHVKQAGSVVAPNYLRFDFTHYQPISKDEIRQIENLVNHYILQNEAVTTNVMAIEEAMQSGAMALFGEKYGSAVRVLSVGGGTFSKELCGGTHVRATGDIGSFKITSDEAVASGVRRIRAITGFDAFERFRDDERMIDESLGFLKTQRDQLPNAIEKLQEELKRMRRENDELKMKIATGAIGSVS
ncbi:MAG: alanine--tRNA ligase, partial [Pyrinomonadaceae bacterium]